MLPSCFCTGLTHPFSSSGASSLALQRAVLRCGLSTWRVRMHGCRHCDSDSHMMLFDNMKRRAPRLRPVADAGWGFSDCGFGEREDVPLGPEQKREHLFAFWKTKVRQLLF